MGKRYTLEEIEYYNENFNKKEVKEIAHDLGRTYSSLRSKMHKIKYEGFKLPKPRQECNYKKMLQFAKQLNPKYNYMTEVFNDYGVKEFINLYKNKS
ncbi:MAG: hypothetical protein GY823_11865 [Flavobacteriaceae bacterium]|nr:hypothetical protein [Flavobacteriaceae bacterium]